VLAVTSLTLPLADCHARERRANLPQSLTAAAASPASPGCSTAATTGALPHGRSTEARRLLQQPTGPDLPATVCTTRCRASDIGRQAEVPFVPLVPAEPRVRTSYATPHHACGSHTSTLADANTCYIRKMLHAATQRRAAEHCPRTAREPSNSIFGQSTNGRCVCTARCCN
jgi:hypothetical protein